MLEERQNIYPVSKHGKGVKTPELGFQTKISFELHKSYPNNALLLNTMNC